MHYFLDGTKGVAFAFWVGIIALVLALLLFFGIVVMRWVTQYREQQHELHLKRWRRRLAKIASGSKVSLPKLSPQDATEFAEVWNDLNEAFPDVRERLRGVGEKVGLSEAASQLLQGRYHHRAMAIIALGHQGNARDFAQLEPFLADPNPITSWCSARALAQIDADRAMELFVPALAERQGCSEGKRSCLFQESDDSTVKALARAALHGNRNSAARLVRFLVDTDADRAAPVIRRLLQSKADDHVISTCLQVVTDRSDLGRVRSFLDHPRWHVRMHAASALGRLGDRSDEARLSTLLSDPYWWVRYRTAQALRSLPGVRDEGIRRISLAQRDTFAREIIEQVLAEPIGGTA